VAVIAGIAAVASFLSPFQLPLLLIFTMAAIAFQRFGLKSAPMGPLGGVSQLLWAAGAFLSVAGDVLLFLFFLTVWTLARAYIWAG